MKLEGTTRDVATSIWDERYDKGETACGKEADGTDPIDYTQHDFLYRYLVCKPLTGIPTSESYDFLMRSIFNLVTPKLVLAVGSGLGFAEQRLVSEGIVERIEAYELSSVAVASANERLVAAGLADRMVMHAGNVIDAGLEENSFDAVFVNAALHHFFNVEEMMDLFYKVLKPGGILVYNEYVGPDHHMYHDKVMATLDKINDCLDEKFRYDVLRNEIRSLVPRATLEWMLEMDPSEGVHASKILPLTYQKFDVVQRFDFGGTLMRPFWVGILNNFDFTDYKDQTIARLIGLIEELLIDSGEIPNYHTIVAARKGQRDLSKKLIDNEILSYKTHDYETEKLVSSIVDAQSVATCVNHTDENWVGGVIRGGSLRLLLADSRQALDLLKRGKRIVLSQSKTCMIDAIEHVGNNIIVSCRDATFDRSEIQAPARFWVSEF